MYQTKQTTYINPYEDQRFFAKKTLKIAISIAKNLKN